MEIYKRIAAQGHRVVVVCGNYRGAPRVEWREGVYYRHIGLPHSHIVSRLTYMVGAARLIKRGGYDIVIEDVSPFSPVGAPMWSGRAHSIASVQNLSGMHATRKYGPLGLGPKLVEGPLLSRFRRFVAVSPGIGEELRRAVPGANIKVIPNSAGHISPAEISWETTSSPSEAYILSLGRIDVYQKGLDRLVAAFSILAENLPQVRLKIAGGGTEDQVAKLRSLVERAPHGDRIELLGQVEREEAARLLRGALMLAMPSRYEAWPLSAIEAGAAGIPVVGFNMVGVRDAAPPYPQAHGRLVPEGDIKALTREMSTLATNKELRTKIGSKGQEWANRFTWDALAAEQLAFYEETLRET